MKAGWCARTAVAAAVGLAVLATGWAARLVGELGVVYAQVPAWWDQTYVTMPTGVLSRVDACWTWVSEHNPPGGRLVENWAIAGPFGGAKGTGIDTPYAPESGAGSLTVAWREWPARAACPLTGAGPDTIAYLRKVVDFSAASHGGFTVTSRTAYRLWVDGQPVAGAGAAGDDVYVPLPLSAGRHVVLVKTWLDKGTCAWRTAWTSVDPRWTEVKSRSLVVASFPRDAAALRAQGPRLAELYLDLDDGPNGRFWVRRALAGASDNGVQVANVLHPCFGAARGPAASAALADELAAVLGRTPKNDAELRRVLVRGIVEMAAARGRPGDAAAALRAAGVTPSVEDCARMLRVGLATNSIDGVAFWAEGFLQSEAREDVVSSSLAGWLKGAPDGFRQALYAAMERVVVASTNEARRRLVADRLVSDAIARKDSRRAAQFLKDHRATLDALMPFQAALWRLQVAMLDGDEDASREALAAAVRQRPDYTNSADYATYRARVFKLDTTDIDPAVVELTPDAVADAAGRLARSGDTNRLCLFIRDTLRAKGHSAIAADSDAGLFVGAKAYYRKALAPYAAIYEEWLRNEIDTLARQPSRRADALRLETIAHLTPSAAGPVGTGGAPVPSIAPLPASAGLRPLLDMAPGTAEVFEQQARFRLGAGRWRAASFSATGADGWIANSRLLACLRGGAVAWSYALPLSQMRIEGDDVSPLRAVGHYAPAVAGDVVAARLFLPDGRPAIVGVGYADGRFRWIWRGNDVVAAGLPAAWGTNAFVALAETVPPAPARWAHNDARTVVRTELVMLDAATGALRLAIPLSDTTLARGRHGRGQPPVASDFSLLAPPPAVEGRIAYVATGCGLVGAVDLVDESLLWMRNYQRFGEERILGWRLPAAPLCGSRGVLFAPPDSNWLLLAEKATGHLIARRTDLGWLEVAPCGPEAAVVLTHASAHVLALDDLRERRALTGRSFGVLQPVRDGCLLTEEDAIVACRADGSVSAPTVLAGGARPLGCSADGLWYAAGGPGDQWCGVAGRAPAGAGPGVRPAAGLASECAMTGAALLSTGGRAPIAGWGSVAAAFDPEGRRLWEIPTLVASGVASVSGCVAVARAGQVWCYDDRAADLFATWPATIGRPPTALQVTAAPDGLYAACLDDQRRLQLWRFGTGPGLVPRLVGQATVVAPEEISRLDVLEMPTQRVVLVSSPAGVTLWTVAPPASAGAPAALQQEAIWSARDAVVWHSTDGRRAAVYARDANRLVRLDERGIRQADGPVKLGRGAAVGTSGDLIYAAMGDGAWQFFDPMTGARTDLKGWKLATVGIRGRCVYGLRKAGGVLPVFGEVGASPVLGAPLSIVQADKWQGVGIVESRGRVVLLVRSADYANVQTFAVSWRGRVVEGARRIPDIPDAGRVWCVPDGVVGVADAWMSPDEWQAVLSRTQTVAASRSTAGVRLDGFLDEWATNEFVAVPLGRLAVRRTGPGEMALAVEIRDAATAERLGTTGVEGNLMPAVLPTAEMSFGDRAGVSPKPVVWHNRFKAEASEWDTDMAWSVAPDGHTCRIELTVKSPAFDRRLLGSRTVSVRLLWRADPAAPLVNLLARGGWGPSLYVTVTGL